MRTEEKPRITITHKRHEKLLRDEAVLDRNIELVKETLNGFDVLFAKIERVKAAGRRLAGIHKHRAWVARQNSDCHKHNWEIDRDRARDAQIKVAALEMRVEQARPLMMEGLRMNKELEERLLVALKRARVAEEKLQPAMVAPSWPGKSMAAKCHAARDYAAHWRATFSELYVGSLPELPWSGDSITDEEAPSAFLVARMMAEYCRNRCEKYAPTFTVFPWETHDETASAQAS
jgi:hypothetical protein